MREQLEQRLKELQDEFAKGQQMLAELDVQRQRLQMQVWQIQGAIAVCEELLSKPEESED